MFHLSIIVITTVDRKTQIQNFVTEHNPVCTTLTKKFNKNLLRQRRHFMRTDECQDTVTPGIPHVLLRNAPI